MFFYVPVENAHQWILWAQNIKERITQNPFTRPSEKSFNLQNEKKD